MELTSELAVGLGLLFHELATNALKYGALSKAGGRVQIGWTRDVGDLRPAPGRKWVASAVSPPSKKGFGSRSLDVALIPQGGKAERRFEPQGLVCELRIPSAAPAQSPALPGAVFARTVASESGVAGSA